MTRLRQPAIFISHGGGPCFSMDIPGRPFENLRAYLAGLIKGLPERPSAILIISAHWEEDLPTVSMAANPSMVFDYYGFPEHTYRLKYPAQGSPKLARQVLEFLADKGFEVGSDSERGFDHGVFVPMLVVDPDASIPVTMLSLRRDLDPAAHIAIGRALAPLRDEGVLILGSGNSFHNLRSFMNGLDASSSDFDAWLTATVCGTVPSDREAKLVDWTSAPGALNCHPRSEHLLPLMVVAGAGAGEVASRDYHDKILGKTISGYRFGQK